tara:strand:- start:1785 stop:2591 length:807 start_codon:yes stop_codon:yes gene_type:complete
MKKILIIGKRGFLGKNLHKYFNKKFKSKIIHFKDIYKFKKEINGFNYVINTSINKNYINKRYLKKYDNDLKISKLINSRETTYIFLSSRKVYKEKANIKEESKLLPKSHYSKNKLITEQNLKKEFGKNLLILRISNIIGYKENLKNHLHETFIDYFYKYAKRGIIFNNLKRFKDFISVKKFCQILEMAIKKNLRGTFNLSIGRKVYLNDIVEWLNKFNKKKIKVIKLREYNDRSFYLNNSKLMKKIRIKNTLNELKADCMNLSKKLFN